jgi:uncharacterized membrane protein (DUF4010 family)
MQYLTSLFVSIGLGLIIGLEREFRLVSQKDRFAGIRTFPLVTILGSIVGLLSQTTSPWLTVIALFGMILFAGIAYFVRSSSGHTGITTEVTIVIAFVLGVMCSAGLLKEALAAAVVTTTFLSLKDVFHSFVSRITQEELFAFIKFAIISMLMLPFLPDQGYGPGEILNPWDIGVVIVTISILSFASYILMKFAGAQKGIIIASLLGGLISSTAVTWVFSGKSKNDETRDSHYAVGIILASSIMPLRVSVVALIFVNSLFQQLVIPCALMSAAGLFYSYVLFRKKSASSHVQALDLDNPINLANAAYSTILYIGVLLLVYYSKIFFGQNGLLITGFVSGIADVDAITIAMSNVISTSHLPIYIVILAMTSNNLLKIIIAATRAGDHIRSKIITGLSLIAIIGIAYMLTNLFMDRQFG